MTKPRSKSSPPTAGFVLGSVFGNLLPSFSELFLRSHRSSEMWTQGRDGLIAYFGYPLRAARKRQPDNSLRYDQIQRRQSRRRKARRALGGCRYDKRVLVRKAYLP